MAKLSTLALLGTLGLAGCSRPQIEEVRDMNQDSMPDIQVRIPDGFQKGRWIFLAQEDGNYLRLKQSINRPHEFIAPDKSVYFINAEDGNLYQAKNIKQGRETQ